MLGWLCRVLQQPGNSVPPWSLLRLRLSTPSPTYQRSSPGCTPPKPRCLPGQHTALQSLTCSRSLPCTTACRASQAEVQTCNTASSRGVCRPRSTHPHLVSFVLFIPLYNSLQSFTSTSTNMKYSVKPRCFPAPFYTPSVVLVHPSV